MMDANVAGWCEPIADGFWLLFNPLERKGNYSPTLNM